MLKLNTIIAILFLLQCFSCQSDGNWERVDSPVLLTNSKVANIINSKDYEQLKDINFPSLRLFNGQILTIQYIRAGCFGYQNEIVRIKRMNDDYLLSCNKLYGNIEVQLVCDSTINSSFISTLDGFRNYCKRNILESKHDLSKKDIYSTTTESLTINDGLHVIDVPMTDKTGYYSLIREFLKENYITN